jgi:hypothetical protein
LESEREEQQSSSVHLSQGVEGEPHTDFMPRLQRLAARLRPLSSSTWRAGALVGGAKLERAWDRRSAILKRHEKFSGAYSAMYDRLVEIEGEDMAEDLRHNGALGNMADAVADGAIVKLRRKGPMSFSVEFIKPSS